MRRNPAPRPGRCSRAERDARVGELQAMIAGGAAPNAAARACAARWGLKGRRSRTTYLARALVSWRRESRLDQRAALSIAVARRERLFGIAVAAGDLATAARLLDALDRIQGVGAPDEARAMQDVVDDLMQVIVAESPDVATAKRILGAVRRVFSGEPEPPRAERNGHALPLVLPRPPDRHDSRDL